MFSFWNEDRTGHLQLTCQTCAWKDCLWQCQLQKCGWNDKMPFFFLGTHTLTLFMLSMCCMIYVSPIAIWKLLLIRYWSWNLIRNAQRLVVFLVPNLLWCTGMTQWMILFVLKQNWMFDWDCQLSYHYVAIQILWKLILLPWLTAVVSVLSSWMESVSWVKP